MNVSTAIAAVLIVALSVACHAQDGGQPPQVITQLKPLHPDTAIVSDGRPEADVVVPEGDRYRAMAVQVQEAVEEATGATLQIRLHHQVDTSSSDRHLILLGNMDNSKAVERLYWRRYVASDLDYPGADGHEVRTVCDPWGTGKNAIMLGGSDEEGVRRAVEVLLAHVKPGTDLVLPHLLDIRLPGIETITEEVLQKEWEDYRERYLDAKGLWYGAEKGVFRLAYDYYLTGVEEYARLYNEVIKRWMEEYYRHSGARQLDYPKYDIPDMMLSWDLVEESPSISDQVRLEMSNLLYDYAIRMSEYGRVADWQPREMRNTGHIPLLSVVYGHSYFSKHYPDLPGMERLTKGVDDTRTAFESYSGTEGFMSETGYLGMHPRMLTYYTQYTGDYTWFENRNALRWQEYHTLVTDNRGTAMGGWSPAHLLAARYYGDGRWLWLSNFQRGNDDYSTRVVNGKLNGNRWFGRPDLEPTQPMELTGLRVFQPSEQWYEQLTRVRGRLDVPREKAFNQAVMRTDFDPSSQYLRIAGINIGFHYGAPANAVSVLHDKGRGWVTNGRWGMSLMKYYNTMLVVRDGQASPRIPYVCSLETAVDLPSSGFLQSRMPNYNSTDWTRSVVWNKQRYWLIFDSVRAQDAAEYTSVCQWRTGPRPQVADGRAVVGTGDPALVVETVGEPTLATIPEGAAHGQTNSYMYRQQHTGRLAAGQEAGFANLLWVRGGTAAIEGWQRWQSDATTAALDGDNPHSGRVALRLVNTGDAWRCVMQGLPELEPQARYRVSGWARTNGKVQAVMEVRAPGGEPANLGRAATAEQQWTRLELEFSAPAQGQGVELWLIHNTYRAAEGIAWYDDLVVARADEPEESVLVNGDFEAAGDVARMTAQYSVRGLPDGCAIVSDGSSYWIAGAAGDAQPRAFEPHPDISATAKAFNLTTDGFSLAGGTALQWPSYNLTFSSDRPLDIEYDAQAGTATVVAAEPAALSIGGWQRQVEAGRHEFDLQPTPLAGTATGATAEAVWEAARRPGSGVAEQLLGHALATTWQWQTGEEQGAVKVVKTADLTGDGRPETMVGMADGATVVLSADGAEICRHQAEKTVNDVTYADLNGDGRQEVIAASDDFHVYVFDLQGRELWKFSNENLEITNKFPGELSEGVYTSSEGEFISLKIADITGDGTPEVLAGAKTFMHGNRRVYGTLWALSAQGRPLWHAFNFSGTVDTIDCADVTGDGKLEIAIGTGGGTYGRRCYIVDNEGRLLANYGGGYGEKRAAFARLQPEGPLALVRVEYTDGTAWAHAADATAEQWWSYNSSGLTTFGPIITDFDGDGTDEILIAGESGDVYLLSGADEAKLLWRTNVGSAVSSLQVTRLDGRHRILVGTRSGALFMLDGQGAVLAHAELGSDVISMDAMGEARRAVVGLHDGRTVAVALQ